MGSAPGGVHWNLQRPHVMQGRRVATLEDLPQAMILHFSAWVRSGHELAQGLVEGDALGVELPVQDMQRLVDLELPVTAPPSQDQTPLPGFGRTCHSKQDTPGAAVLAQGKGRNAHFGLAVASPQPGFEPLYGFGAHQQRLDRFSHGDRLGQVRPGPKRRLTLPKIRKQPPPRYERTGLATGPRVLRPRLRQTVAGRLEVTGREAQPQDLGPRRDRPAAQEQDGQQHRQRRCQGGERNRREGVYPGRGGTSSHRFRSTTLNWSVSVFRK